MDAEHHLQVSVTASSPDEARRLGSMAVERRLAACAQVSGPVTSTYWWEGEVTTAQEWVCVLKTRSSLLVSLTEALREAHSYEVPEIIATPIGGDAAYLGWIDDETREADRTQR